MSKKEKRDSRFDRLKFVAYCKSNLPPEGVELTYEDFLEYAKFQLSLEKGVLLKDPIWEKYTDEELLVEYYANLFEKNESAKKEFETVLAGVQGDDGFEEWADKQIASSKPEEPKDEEDEESFEFVPEEPGE